MSARLRVTVVGAGILGLSTARALVKGGHRVTVVEQYGIPNLMGSSVDESRLIRLPYGASRGYARLIAPAFRAWEGVWADLGRRLYAETGTLSVGTASNRWLSESARVLKEERVPFTLLSRAEIEARYPLVRGDGVDSGLLVEQGGILAAQRIVAELAGWLEGQGAVLRPHTRVESIDAHRGRVMLAGGEPIDADMVVVAAGPWVRRLVPDAPVTASRQVVVYLQPPAGLAAQWARMPAVTDVDQTRGIYLIPPAAGATMKVGDHTFTRTGDPDARRDVTTAEVDALLALCRARLARFDAFRVLLARVCFYTVEAEERFVVRPLGPAAWLGSACSGHGFKFGPLLGERIASALEGRLDPGALTREAAGDI